MTDMNIKYELLSKKELPSLEKGMELLLSFYGLSGDGTAVVSHHLSDNNFFLIKPGEFSRIHELYEREDREPKAVGARIIKASQEFLYLKMKNYFFSIDYESIKRKLR